LLLLLLLLLLLGCLARVGAGRGYLNIHTLFVFVVFIVVRIIFDVVYYRKITFRRCFTSPFLTSNLSAPLIICRKKYFSFHVRCP